MCSSVKKEKGPFTFLFVLHAVRDKRKHVVGVVQQIAICTWTGPGGNWGRKKERDEEKGGIDRGGGGEMESERESI